MDETIQCKCGNNKWVIGTGGIRCPKCHFWLPYHFKLDVINANKYIKNPNPEELYPMLCVQHGGGPAGEVLNERHEFVCPKCVEKDES